MFFVDTRHYQHFKTYLLQITINCFFSESLNFFFTKVERSIYVAFLAGQPPCWIDQTELVSLFGYFANKIELLWDNFMMLDC